MANKVKRITWTVEKRKLTDIKEHPSNPRQFTEKGMKDLENSINSIGFMQPININKDGTILSGHARAKKLKEMGEINVDVYVPDRVLTTKQEEEVLIRANANTAGQWDFDILANEFELEELNDWGLEVPDMDLDPDYSILDDDDVDNKIDELSQGVRKAIMVDFDIDHYEEAFAVFKYWRNKDAYVGKMVLDFLKKEMDKS
tara:strand:+ start:143 stop:745 length:603 start_codon:yes stop_codon:yes gene_type:complete